MFYTANNEKNAYKVLQNLIKNEWKTDLTFDAVNGVARFNGFYGDYTVTVEYGDTTVTKKLRLDINGSKVRSVTV